MTPPRAICLRGLQDIHLEATLRWMNDPQLMRLLNRVKPISEEEHRRWFASLSQQTETTYFAIEDRRSSAHVGNVWLWEVDHQHEKAEVRIMIGESADRGNGTGTRALSLLADYAFHQLHLHKLYAYVLCSNQHAVRAFKKAGFLIEGTLREDRMSDGLFADVYLLGLLKQDYAHD